MPVCAKCGHEFNVGRFCTNCGHPIDTPVEDTDEGLAFWRSDTAERADTAGRADTAERPVEPGPSLPPPPAAPPPPPPEEGARFPLYADEVTTPVRREPGSSDRPERPWLPWAAGAVALLLVAGLGAWLLLGDDDSDPDLVADEPQSTPSEPDPQDRPAKPRKQTEKPPATGQSTDVASLATAEVPATAQPGTDFDGNVVQYEAPNMLDGVPGTCWRMPGDGSGETITLALADKTELTTVGLVNGYAKTGTDASGNALDWYTGNRRILAVEWAFDDGSVVTQDLTETRKLQKLKIDPVTTSTVGLRLVTVTPPGEGPSRRDYTAISEVTAVGTPA